MALFFGSVRSVGEDEGISRTHWPPVIPRPSLGVEGIVGEFGVLCAFDGLDDASAEEVDDNDDENGERLSLP